MDKEVPKILYGTAIFLLVLVSAVLLRVSGIVGKNFLAITSPESLAAFFISAPLVFLAAALPLCYGLVSMLTHSKGKASVYGIALGGAVPAAVIALIISGFTFEKILLAVFFLISLAVVIETSYLKKDELKKYVTFRTASASAKGALLVVAAGLFISSASIGLAQNDQNVKLFGEKVIELAFSQKSGSSELASALADSLLKSQQLTLASIISSGQYKQVAAKTDADSQAFAAYMNAYGQALQSPDTKQKLVQELKRASSSQGTPITFKLLRSQSPAIGFIADYYWLINAAGLTTMFVFFANLLLSNLAGLYAALIRKVLEAVEAEKNSGSG